MGEMREWSSAIVAWGGMGRIGIRRERPEREWSATKEEKARGGLREMKEEAAAAVFRIWERT